MSLVLVTLVIGLLNLCLGYALAVRYGYGPPSVMDTWEVLLAGRPVKTTDPQKPAPVEKPPAPEKPVAAEEPGSANEPGKVEGPPSVEKPAVKEEPDARLIGELISDPLSDIFDEPAGDPHEEVQPESFHETGAEDSSEEDDPYGLEYWDPNEKFIETSVLKLSIAMMKSGARATEIDTRLREVQGHSDVETIQSCLGLLLDDCETYLAEQSEIAQSFHSRISELGDLASLGEEIEMANLEQAAQIETTVNNLRFMDFESDLEAANGRLLEEIKNLRIARHKLRDDQEKAFLIIARHENRIDRVEPRLCNDTLTKLPNRIGLEAMLWRWWKEGRPRTRQICAALYDLDHFGRVNQSHGSRLADRILRELARVIREAVGEPTLAGRFAGQRFLVVMSNVGPRTATKDAELIQQSIERITFLHGKKEIRVTASVAITEAGPDQAYNALLERLEQGLRTAKKAGPNRSVFHDGQEAALMESIDLRAEYTEIVI